MIEAICSQGVFMSEEDALFKYIPHVTLRQVWNEGKVALLSWLIFTALFGASKYFLDFNNPEPQNFWNTIPKFVWFIIGFGLVTLVMRGQEVKFRLPKSLRLWALLNLLVVILALGDYLLSDWAMIPLYTAAITAGILLDNLIKVGKENYENSKRLELER